MTRASCATRYLAALVALAAAYATAGSEAAIENHFILPCRDECASPRWVVTGSLTTARDLHTATLLADGKVLVAGGLVDRLTSGYSAFENPILDSAELYDPDTATLSETGDLVDGRYWHTMTLLQDGRVLAARGSDQGDLWYKLTSAEVYDPTSATWERVPDSTLSSVFHTATLLADERVLFAGGMDYVGTMDSLEARTLSSAERFDPGTGTWSSAGALNFARTRHTMTPLADGTVLVVGDSVVDPDRPPRALASAERYVARVRLTDAVAPQRVGRPFDPARAFTQSP